MDTKLLRDKIKIMEAYENGAEIESRLRNSHNSWEADEDPNWDWPSKDYRIKIAELDRMTNRQLAQILNWGYGEIKSRSESYTYPFYDYDEETENELVDNAFVIRPWNSTEWREPTKSIYDDYIRRLDRIFNILKDSEELIGTLFVKNNRGEFVYK